MKNAKHWERAVSWYLSNAWQVWVLGVLGALFWYVLPEDLGRYWEVNKDHVKVIVWGLVQFLAIVIVVFVCAAGVIAGIVGHMHWKWVWDKRMKAREEAEP